MTKPKNPPPTASAIVPRYGQCGSPERLKVLEYLSDKPKGATLATLGLMLGLDAKATTQVVRALRADSKLLIHRNGGEYTYYTRAARELQAMRHPKREVATC